MLQKVLSAELPPLRAVQVFETVGRCGSISAAAEELGVSAGAITQQIRLLESHLKVRLVERSGRGIRLTDWGVGYLPYVQGSMEQLRKGARELRSARQSNHFTLSALPSLANRWLGPLLFDWKKLHPTVDILIEGVDPEPHLDQGEADFRVSYGSRQRFHQRCAHLFTDFLVPVISPTLLAGSARPARPREVLNFPLLGIDWGPEFAALPTWRDWLVAAGVRGERPRCDLTFSLSSAALDAAAQGRGIVLAQYSMVAGCLHAGSLVRLFEQVLPLPEAYFLAWNGSAMDKPLGIAFHAWLTGEARRLDQAHVCNLCRARPA